MSEAGRPRVVVLTGAGVSAESGLPTFRDDDGIWRRFDPRQVATADAMRRNRAQALAFFDEIRRASWAAEPNAAHRAIAELERRFDVDVVTQNIDELHERAGSSRVLHLHGRLHWARGSGPQPAFVRIDDRPIAPDERCAHGTLLRPDVVLFGEDVPLIDQAAGLMRAADRVLVVGTSLSVWPAAGLVLQARRAQQRVLVALDVDDEPPGYDFRRGRAGEVVPQIVAQWLG